MVLLYQDSSNCQVRRKYYLMARWRITAIIFSAKATAWSIMEGLFSDTDKKYVLVTTNNRLTYIIPQSPRMQFHISHDTVRRLGQPFRIQEMGYMVLVS
jgi:hypothetical protein